MPGWNTTVQDYSPLISYNPFSAWSAGSNSLEYYNDGYTSTSTINATATYECTGSGVWIYGAKGPDHGAYTVILDGMASVFEGNSTERFQALLFGASGLDFGTHVVELVNSGGELMDVDFITCQHSRSDDENILQQMYVDVGSRQWLWDGDWWMDRNSSSASTSVIHSNVSNATATLQFKGDHVDLYGQIGPSCGSFLVYLDGEVDARTFNCNSSKVHSQVLLYSADVISRGDQHSLKVANLAVSEPSTLYLEHAVVISSRDGSQEDPDPPGYRSPLSKNAQTGIIVGSAVGLPLLGLLCTIMCLRRWRQNRHRQSTKEVLPDHSKRPNLEREWNVESGQNKPGRPTVYLALPSPSPSTPSSLSPISPRQAQSRYRPTIVRAKSSPEILPNGNLGGEPINTRRGVVPWLVIPEAGQRSHRDSPMTPLAPIITTRHPFGLIPHPLPPTHVALHEPSPVFLRSRDEKHRRDRLSHPPPPNYWQATSQRI